MQLFDETGKYILNYCKTISIRIYMLPHATYVTTCEAMINQLKIYSVLLFLVTIESSCYTIHWQSIHNIINNKGD